jgi:hypothetical protein
MRVIISIVPLLFGFALGWRFAGHYLPLGLAGAVFGSVWPLISMPFMKPIRDPRVRPHQQVELAAGPTSAILAMGVAACLWVVWEMASTDILSRMSPGMGTMMVFLMAFGITGLLSAIIIVQRRSGRVT